MFNNTQINRIRLLNPLENSKFQYDSNRWNALDYEYRNLIQDFEGKYISRGDVIKAYEEYFRDPSKCFMRPFLLTMVWGFAKAGYGAYRTNKYIENKENIKEALDLINNNGQNSLENAFKKLSNIKGLGISYLTKILYFATRAKKLNNYALIFDIRVASALVKITTPKEIFEIVTVGPSSKFDDYEKYNTLIHKLADCYKVEAEKLEMYLFEQDFS